MTSDRASTISIAPGGPSVKETGEKLSPLDGGVSRAYPGGTPLRFGGHPMNPLVLLASISAALLTALLLSGKKEPRRIFARVRRDR
jgi:hypothetical protein